MQYCSEFRGRPDYFFWLFCAFFFVLFSRGLPALPSFPRLGLCAAARSMYGFTSLMFATDFFPFRWNVTVASRTDVTSYGPL